MKNHKSEIGNLHSTIMTILIFFIVLSLLVFVHELGHFLAAKRAGVRIEEFGFGLPPRLFGKKFRGTLYSINLLPIGGFVRLTGEDMGEQALIGDPGSFQVKSPKRRALILVSGVIGNLLLAWAIFTFLLNVGLPVFNPKPLLIKVFQNSIAEKSGLKPGDAVLKIDGKNMDFHWEVSKYIRKHKRQELTLLVSRDGEKLKIKATPDPLLGIEISNFETRTVAWWKSPFYGIIEVSKNFTQLAIGLGGFLYSLVGGPKIVGEVTGVLGIADMTRFFAELGYRYLLQFIGLLSVNLAFMNLIPFPALDGGRLAFVAYEMISGKKPRRVVEEWSIKIGMAVLLAFMLWVTIKDVVRLGWI